MGRFLKDFLINRWNERVFHLPYVIIAVETLEAPELNKPLIIKQFLMQFPSFVERNLVIEIPRNHSVFLSVFVNSFPSCQNTLVISIHFLPSSFPLYCFLLIGLQFTEFDIYEKKNIMNRFYIV